MLQNFAHVQKYGAIKWSRIESHCNKAIFVLTLNNWGWVMHIFIFICKNKCDFGDTVCKVVAILSRHCVGNHRSDDSQAWPRHLIVCQQLRNGKPFAMWRLSGLGLCFLLARQAEIHDQIPKLDLIFYIKKKNIKKKKSKICIIAVKSMSTLVVVSTLIY